MCQGHKQKADDKDCHRDCRVCLIQDFEITTRQQALEDEAQAFDLERLEFTEQVIYEMEHDL